MFQMKNLFNENDSEVKKSKDDKTEYRAKKSSHMKKKSRKSPSKILNYKQVLRSRLTVKQGIFPQAIKTNILSRNDRTLHSPKISANEEINQRLKNYNVLNKLFHEDKSSNKLFLETPPRNVHPESYCPANCQLSHMSVNTSPSPRKSITSSDSVKYYAAQDTTENPSQLSPIGMTKEMEGACMPSADFTYYVPQQAQKILLYQEVCQIVKKTMIMEKVNHFGNFPDMVQELRNKLWEVRSSRDENFNPDALSTIYCKANSVDPFSDDELCTDRSTPSFHTPMQDSSESRTPKSVEMDEALTSSVFEFKLPDGPDMKTNRGRIGCEAGIDDCALLGSEDETDEPKISAYLPRKNDNFRRKYQNSIFSSTLIPTCKLDQNLTMNPIEFLENLSKTDNDDFHHSNNEFDGHQSRFADTSTKLDDYRSPHRGSSNEWLSTDVGEPFHKDDERSNLGEYRLRDFRTNRNLNISMKHTFDCTKHEESSAPEIANSAGKNQEILSNSEYVFPSLASSNTPEMKYYPCRLY